MVGIPLGQILLEPLARPLDGPVCGKEHRATQPYPAWLPGKTCAAGRSCHPGHHAGHDPVSSLLLRW